MLQLHFDFCLLVVYGNAGIFPCSLSDRLMSISVDSESHCLADFASQEARKPSGTNVTRLWCRLNKNQAYKDKQERVVVVRAPPLGETAWQSNFFKERRGEASIRKADVCSRKTALRWRPWGIAVSRLFFSWHLPFPLSPHSIPPHLAHSFMIPCICLGPLLVTRLPAKRNPSMHYGLGKGCRNSSKHNRANMILSMKIGLLCCCDWKWQKIQMGKMGEMENRG